ncbi:peptidase MA family metallohydrolase [Desulfatiglans anilini]|uniref:peptidase MA family metallohydrolase n=1 Tax=Desulfatiglans anilini TaxID=90728 RepID=UPI00047F515C|nr:hypothetical protein [Desulfatiglans anilini]
MARPSNSIYLILCMLISLCMMGSAWGRSGPLEAIESPFLRVHYEPGLEERAREVLSAYPAANAELEAVFGWRVTTPPDVLLTADRAAFERSTQSRVIVAFAVPARNLIVMECSRGFEKPFSLETILKHEMCHLLLHSRITEVPLPRWFDEGVCQWATDGVSEIVMDQRAGLLDQAVLSGRLIPLRHLEGGFPLEEYPLRLAYEQSKSVVLYIVERYGREALMGILASMASGAELEEVIERDFLLTPGRFEKEWRDDLRAGVSWLSYLSGHLYEILFLLAALASVYAFVRAWIRKRRYLREMPDDPDDLTLH